jgi:hypothetical protein
VLIMADVVLDPVSWCARMHEVFISRCDRYLIMERREGLWHCYREHNGDWIGAGFESADVAKAWLTGDRDTVEWLSNNQPETIRLDGVVLGHMDWDTAQSEGNDFWVHCSGGLAKESTT